jgi:hypothetical protein
MLDEDSGPDSLGHLERNHDAVAVGGDDVPTDHRQLDNRSVMDMDRHR